MNSIVMALSFSAKMVRKIIYNEYWDDNFVSNITGIIVNHHKVEDYKRKNICSCHFFVAVIYILQSLL